MRAGTNGYIPALTDAMVSTKGTTVSTTTSCSVDVLGNQVTLVGLCKNATAAATGTFYLEGTWDDKLWFAIGNFALSSFGYNSVAQSTLSYSKVRVRVTITGTNVEMLFDAGFVFTQQ